MADVCTFVSVVTLAVVCPQPPPVCGQPVDGKVFCQPDWTSAVYTPCNNSRTRYECKRPDGTSYSYEK